MADELSIDNELLISLVEQRPLLWDKTMDLYKSRAATRQAWKEIMLTMYPDFETKKEKVRQAHAKLVVQRWTHIRDNYNRSHKKRQYMENTPGIRRKKVKPYIYSKQLNFLQKVIKLRETISNVISDISNTESDQLNNSEEDETLEINTLQNKDSDRPMINTIPLKRPLHNDASLLDAKVMRFIDSSSYNEPNTTNRHLSFFNGILPSLQHFDEDEVLEFQMGVLQLVKKIKSSNKNRASSFNVKHDPFS